MCATRQIELLACLLAEVASVAKRHGCYHRVSLVVDLCDI